MTPKQKTWNTHLLLQEEYGELAWKPRRKPMHELISTMLSHRTTQANEAEGYDRMWNHFGSWEAIMNAKLDDLIETLHPVQFPAAKAMNIQKVLRIIKEERGAFSIDFLKDMTAEEGVAWLTDLPGVGVKTATLVLLFCFGKPVLPVDTHVHRISQRVGLIGPKDNAEKAHELLQEMLPKDYKVLFNFHLHMLVHGQKVCRWAHPKHAECPLSSFCNYYRQEVAQKATKKRA